LATQLEPSHSTKLARILGKLAFESTDRELVQVAEEWEGAWAGWKCRRASEELAVAIQTDECSENERYQGGLIDLERHSCFCWLEDQ
jgi:hypothetical protein